MSEQPKPTVPGQPPELAEIAKWVLAISGSSILLVATVALWAARSAGPEQFSQTSQLVFNSLLPLLGTWVGTVLAYYFSKKNFESASSSVERMVTLTTEQRLRKLPVDEEMLESGAITKYAIPAGKSPTDVLLTELKARMVGKVTRLPVVDERGAVLYVLHQSGIFKFLSEQALGGKTPPELQNLTLQDLVDDAELQNWVTNIAFLPEGATVADAKQRMEAQPGCQDVVVTRSGAKGEPMLGWMTNVDIGRLSKA